MTKKVEKQPLEHLTDEQLDEFLDYSGTPFPDDSKDNIKKQFKTKTVVATKNTRFRRKAFGFAAIAASTLLLTGFAFRDELKLTYQKHFGSGTEVLLTNSDRLDQTVEDQGLRLTAVGSFKDDDTTYFVAQLTDLTGDRLSEETRIESWQMLNGGNSQVVDYDPSTKTATIVTMAIDMGDNIAPGYILESFTSNEVEFEETYSVDWQSIPVSDNWQSRPAFGGKGGGSDDEALHKLGLNWDTLSDSYLAPSKTIIELGDYANISALGYKDGLLHLQLKEINQVGSETFVSLKNRETGEVLQDIASFSVDEGTHNNETGRPDYNQHVFTISEEELNDYDLVVDGWSSQVYQKGQWPIQLEEPQDLPSTTLPDQNIGDLKLENIRLSPVSLSFDYQGEIKDMTIEMVLKDGTNKEMTYPYFMEDYRNDYEWQFGLIDLDDVEAVKINGEMLDLG